MSLVSQQQLLQNQIKLQNLEAQSRKQSNKTKSMLSNNSEMTARTSSTIGPVSSAANLANPLTITLPTHANPTEILAARFNTWRNIIAALSHYLKEIVSVNEEVTRQQIRLHHAITFPFLTQGLDGDFYQPLRVASSVQANGNSTIAGQLFHTSNDKGTGPRGNADTDLSKQNNEFDIARKMFLPLGSGSVQDLPTILYQYHSSAALLSQATVKELNNGVVPRLEDLKRDLLVKIKEIKSLQSDFKNNVDRYQSETQTALNNYLRAIDLAKNSPSQLEPKNDPYLLKIILDRAIKRQLTEENYLHEAFNNIQISGCELEKVVYVELQSALTIYAKLIGQQAQNIFDGLLAKLDSTLLTKEPSIEWDNFVANDNHNFVSSSLPMRRVSEIKYNHQYDPLTTEYRSGYLERKSKYLKSYAKGYYVLTPTFLHEFKSPDRKKDPVPVMSLPISELRVTEHSRRDDENPSGYHKFVIQSGSSGSGGLLGRSHKWVFRVDGYQSMMNWYGDIKKFAGLSSTDVRASVANERRKQKRMLSGVQINSNVNTREGSIIDVSSASILNRQRGVSSVTDRTERSNNASTLNETPITSPPESHIQPQKSNPGKFALDNALIDPIVTVPVQTKKLISEDTQIKSIQPVNEAPIEQINKLEGEPSYVKEALNTEPPSQEYTNEQAQILQEQAFLEQQQQELLNKQRELQQRALSLTSRTLSLTSTTNTASAHASPLNALKEGGQNEIDSQKVGELSP